MAECFMAGLSNKTQRGENTVTRGRGKARSANDISISSYWLEASCLQIAGRKKLVNAATVKRPSIQPPGDTPTRAQVCLGSVGASWLAAARVMSREQARSHRSWARISSGFGQDSHRRPTDTNRPMKIHCHCEERSDEAIQMDRHGALRAPRDDNSVKGKGDWYDTNLTSGIYIRGRASCGRLAPKAITPGPGAPAQSQPLVGGRTTLSAAG
jgi:hypothetical protein